jgi:hypothetical protein
MRVGADGSRARTRVGVVARAWLCARELSAHACGWLSLGCPHSNSRGKASTAHAAAVLLAPTRQVDFVPTYVAELAFWPVVQALNFSQV